MAAFAGTPGFDVDVRRLPPPDQQLRTDIAGFVGGLPAGPVRERVVVRDFEEFLALYGAASADSVMGRSLHGYFSNGGEIAHVVRTTGDEVARSVGFADQFGLCGLYLAESRPGLADRGMTVAAEFRRRAISDNPTALVNLTSEGRSVSSLVGSGQLKGQAIPIGRGLVLQANDDIARVATTLLAEQGRASCRANLDPVAVDSHTSSRDYLRCMEMLLDEPSIAIVVMPDVWDVVEDTAAAVGLVAHAIGRADATSDRLILIDLPHNTDARSAAQTINVIRDRLTDAATLRSAACYAPHLVVEDRHLALDRQPRVPPSGHVAGVMSRVDRIAGVGRSPANAFLDDVTDLDGPNAESMRELGVNPIGCIAGRGMQIWGARTLGEPPNEVLAHRRLTHRLVRAMRAVAEPLVFEPHTHALRFALRRAIGSVLLEAFRSGALAGTTPAEAFFVRCDDTTTTESDVFEGRVICECGFAPSRPIEFIRLRVTVANDGQLEVVER